MDDILQNRTEAGIELAQYLTQYAHRQDTLILALPRGGVPVAAEIAQRLDLPLDLCLVRKLGVPHRPELGMGAIASGGVRVLNPDVVEWLDVPDSTIEAVTQSEQQELERRERVYRGDRPLPSIRDRTIILVDDGIATGFTLKAAITALQQQHPYRLIVAVPVAPPSICQELTEVVDQVICLYQPDSLHSISCWYEDFSQTTDEEVCRLLAQCYHSSLPSLR